MKFSGSVYDGGKKFNYLMEFDEGIPEEALADLFLNILEYQILGKGNLEDYICRACPLLDDIEE